MISPKSIDLVYKIHDKTLNDSLCWQETVTEGTFQVVLQNSTIQISRIERDEGNDDIFIRIYNQKSTLIEEITDSEFSRKQDLINISPWMYMNEIYEKARSQALGIEKVINDILSELGDDPQQGTGDEIPF